MVDGRTTNRNSGGGERAHDTAPVVAAPAVAMLAPAFLAVVAHRTACGGAARSLVAVPGAPLAESVIK